MKKIVVLTGAGISAESGIKTFRDSDGLWEGHYVMEVASIDGWYKNPSLVLDFYNKRRAQLKEVEPNQGHLLLAALEKDHDVTIITQNVDNLHERAGSKKVIHLHGELLKVRSTKNPHLIYDWTEDCNIGDLCELGSQMRPHIVWFGEDVPLIQEAAELISECDVLVIIGTSAGLMAFAPDNAQIFYIDKNPNLEFIRKKNIKIMQGSASDCLRELKF